MKEQKRNIITRRQAILSVAAISAGALIKPSSVFCAPVKDKIRFAVIGDWGTGDEDQASTARQMFSCHQRTAFDFIVSAGDNVYPNGAGRHFRKNFEQPFNDLLKNQISFYTVLGNHDVEAGRQDQCQYPLFNMCGGNYYKVAKGDGLVDLFMLDSTDFDAPQASWLEGSLRASTAKWKIAVFHHPIYSSGKKHGSAVGLRKKLEPILTAHGVNAVFSGHDHMYERTHPQKGIQYFVTGAGGKTRRGAVDLASSFRATSFDEDNHFMVIEIDDQEVGFKAISETGVVIDSGAIKESKVLVQS
jgi:3',5'-cyclic AMP phosphodiesterase CpdA